MKNKLLNCIEYLTRTRQCDITIFPWNARKVIRNERERERLKEGEMGAPKASSLERAHNSRSSTLRREKKREIGSRKTSDYSNKKIHVFLLLICISFILCFYVR